MSIRRPDTASTIASVIVDPALGRDAQRVATASGTDAGSPTGASSTTQTPSGNSRGKVGRDLQRQARLADPARAREGDQPVCADEPRQLLDLESRPTSGYLDRQVPGRRIQGAQRCELEAVSFHLEDLLGLAEILQTMFAQIDDVTLAGQCSGCR